ncbi:methylmalonyl-CoA epimerase [Candidatus Puniceispirillum sp.]|nr:methylmalonyl-CoA epimerase [Candidatus Puniceispirillum sp.]
MIGRINHIAMVVPDLDVAAARWRDMLGADISAPNILEDHGVRIVFIRSVNGQVELMEPYGEKSPISGFLQRNPDGGLHHICYEVNDISLARRSLEAKGARVLGDGLIKMGAHGNPVLFLHPKDFNGALIELEQTSAGGAE